MSADTSSAALAGEAGPGSAAQHTARRAATAQKSSRAFYTFSGLLLVIGGVLINNGGFRHPRISMDMGTFGSPTFYTHFAQMMQEPNWYLVHGQIMVGPILATLGLVGVVALVRSRGDSRWSSMGLVALSIGTGLWTLVYSFDGFISPKLAPLLLNSSPDLEPAMNAVFGASQWVSITVALPGWILMSVGQMLIGVAVLVTRSAGPDPKLTTVVGGIPVLLGLSNLLAWATGSFDPGPMISPWWFANAFFGSLWFIVAGVWLILRSRTPERAPAV